MLRTKKYCMPWCAQMYLKTTAIYKESAFVRAGEVALVKRT